MKPEGEEAEQQEDGGVASYMVTISEEDPNLNGRGQTRNSHETEEEHDNDATPQAIIQILEPLPDDHSSEDYQQNGNAVLLHIEPSTPPPEEVERNKQDENIPLSDEEDEHYFSRNSTPEYPMYIRATLLEQYREAIDQRSKLHNTNVQTQHKLAEYFRKKKTDDRGQEAEKNVTDQDQRYLKYISNLEEIQSQYMRQKDQMQAQIEELKEKCNDKQSRVAKVNEEFMEFKYDIAASAINSRSGKPISKKDLEQYKGNETKKENDVIQARYENIKLKNRLKKRESQLKAKEELAEGLHLIDFEQLKIENQTYNEKIEERNEELLKLRKKITTTVQISTHLKEKLQFVQAENGDLRLSLKENDQAVAETRDASTMTKRERDKLRTSNAKLKQSCGLLGNEVLLSDFEDQRQEMEDLQKNIQVLKDSHIELSLTVNGIRKKIEQSKEKESDMVK